MLSSLRISHIGPVPDMRLNLGSRLNLITGDNGLGKTLLLDSAWYALTNTWPFAWPGKGLVPTDAEARIEWEEEQRSVKRTFRAGYSFKFGSWGTSAVSGHGSNNGSGSLVVYARVDGGFSISDPLRVGQDLRGNGQIIGKSTCFQFDSNEAWDGLALNNQLPGTRVSEGLIRDWMQWALEPGGQTFERFSAIVQALSPTEKLVPLKKWERVFLDDARDIPLLQTTHGEIPIVHVSAAVRRMLGLAYILVWAWREHQVIARLKKQAPLSSMVLLMDEVEAHLHPQWQRRVAPALVAASQALGQDVQFQALLTTHSPLVLASLEPHFDADRDRIFHLTASDGPPRLEELPFVKQGDVVNWLASEHFGLQQGRSIEAERAIEAAEAFMRGDSRPAPAGP